MPKIYNPVVDYRQQTMSLVLAIPIYSLNIATPPNPTCQSTSRVCSIYDLPPSSSNPPVNLTPPQLPSPNPHPRHTPWISNPHPIYHSLYIFITTLPHMSNTASKIPDRERALCTTNIWNERLETEVTATLSILLLTCLYVPHTASPLPRGSTKKR